MILDHINNTQPIQATPSASPTKTKLVQMGVWIYRDENKDFIKKVTRWSSYDNQEKQIYQFIRYDNRWVTKTSFNGSEAEWTKLYNYASSIPFNLPTLLENKDESNCLF
jgi:hypothetical protein